MGRDVVVIGDYSFAGLGSQSSSDVTVTASGSLTSIGRYAFQYAGCAGHSFTFDIPDSVTSIGQNAFAGLGKNTPSIGQSHVTAYIGLPYNPSFTSIPANMFSGNGISSESNYPRIITVIPSGVTSVGAAAFYRTHSEIWLESDSVTSVGANGLPSSDRSLVIASGVSDYDSYRTGVMRSYSSVLTYRFDVIVEADGGTFGNGEGSVLYSFLYGKGLYWTGGGMPEVSGMSRQGSSAIPMPDAARDGYGIRRWYDLATSETVESLDSSSPWIRVVRAEWGEEGLVDVGTSGYYGVYDGNIHSITASSVHGVTSESPSVYVWYIVSDGVPVPTGAPSSPSLPVRDADQSGTYRCEMIMYGAHACSVWTDDIPVYIVPAPVSVSGLSAASREYDGGTSADVIGIPVLTWCAEGDDVSVITGSASFEDAHAGRGKTVNFTGYSLAGEDSGNYVLDGPPASHADILPRSVSIEGAYAEDKVYDGTCFANVAGDLAIAGMVPGDDLCIVTGQAGFSDDDAGGSVRAVFSGFSLGGTASSDYVLSSQPAPVSAAILPRPVTLTVSCSGREYDGTADMDMAGCALDGALYWDDLYVSAGECVMSGRDAGVQTVEFSGFSLAGRDSKNYVLSSQPSPVTVVISRKSVGISGLYAADKVYDGTCTASFCDTFSLPGAVDGDDVRISAGAAAFGQSGAGRDIPVRFSGFGLEGADAANYVLASQPGDSVASISRRAVSVSVGEVSGKVYDGTDTASYGDAVLSGIIPGDRVYISEGDARFDSPDAGDRMAVFSGFGITGRDSGNYVLVSQPDPVPASVSRKDAVITASVAASKTYDGSIKAEITDIILGGKVEGDVVFVAQGVAEYRDADAGAGKPVDFSGFSIYGTDSDNYRLVSQPGTVYASVVPRCVTVTGVFAESKIYDGSTSAGIGGMPVLSGIVPGDDVSPVIGTASFRDARAGYGKSADFGGFSLAGDDAGNYVLSSQPSSVTADIIPREVEIAGLRASGKIYDGSTSAVIDGTPSIEGMVPGDDLAVSYGTAVFDGCGASAGRNVIFSGFSLAGKDSPNYVLKSQPASARSSILPREIVIEGLSAADKTYDRTSSATVTGIPVLSGYVPGDDLRPVMGCASFSDADAGTDKVVTFSGFALQGDSASDYILSSQPASVKADILPKAVSVSPVDVSDKVYDGTAGAWVSAEVFLSGVLDGDHVSLSFGAAQFENPDAGTDKTVTFSGYRLLGRDRANYFLSSQPPSVTADIMPRPVTIGGVGSSDRVYDGTVRADVGGTPVLEGVIEGDSVIIVIGTAYFDSRDAGTDKTVRFGGFSLGGADSANYVLCAQPDPVTASVYPMEIDPPEMAVSDKVYDGTVSAEARFDPVPPGVITGDSVMITSGSASFDSADAGTDKVVTFSGFALSGEDSGNYVLKTQPSPATASVTRRAVTVVPEDSSKLCGDPDPVFGYSAGGLVDPGDLGTVVCSRLPGQEGLESAGESVVVHVSSYTDNPNYDITLGTSVMGIERIPVTVSGITAVSREYDGTDAAVLECGSAVFSGLRDGDSLTVTASGCFDGSGACRGRTVEITGMVLGGSSACRYVLAQSGNQSSCTADILPRQVSITGLGVSDKVYDGTYCAEVTGVPVMDFVADGDDLRIVRGTARFGSRCAGDDVTAIFSGFSITGRDSGNYVLSSQPSPVTAGIRPRDVSITGLGAEGRVYDGTVSADVSGTAVIIGKIEGDDVSAVPGTASFAGPDPGRDIVVSFSGYGLAGTDASNYRISSQPPSVTADIAPRSVTITVPGVCSKTYDGTADAEISGEPVLEGAVNGDDVRVVTGSACFSDASAGDSKIVLFDGFGIAGDDACRYVLAHQPSWVLASITPAVLSVTGLSVAGKTYDGTTSASVTGAPALSGAADGDEVVLVPGSACFISGDASGHAEAVFYGFALSGEDSGNYVLEQPASVTACISPSDIRITGAGSSGKTYDGNRMAAVSGTAVAEGIIGDDDVHVVAGNASFTSPDAGRGREVVFSGFSLSGRDAGNYRVTEQPRPVFADIYARPVEVEGLYAYGKVFDGTTSASAAGTPVLKGVVEGDVLSVSYGDARFDSCDAGERTVSFSGFVLAGQSASNYVLSSQPRSVVAEIRPAELKVSPSERCVYDGDVLTYVLTEGDVSGLVAGDRILSGAVTTVSPDTGVYTSDDGLVLSVPVRTEMGIDNYSVVLDCVVEICKRAPDASCFECVIPVDSVYDEAERTATVSVAGGLEGFGSFRIRYSGTPVDAGGYEVTADVDEGRNYTSAEGILLGRFEITRAPSYVVEHPSGVDSFTDGGVTELATGGTVSGGTLFYSMSGTFEDASEDVPVATEAGRYSVSYMVVGDRNHLDSEVMSLSSVVRGTVTESGCMSVRVSADEASEGVAIAELLRMSAGSGTGARISAGSCAVEFDTAAAESMSSGNAVISVSCTVPSEDGTVLPASVAEGAEAVVELSISGAAFSGGTAKVTLDIPGEVPAGKVGKVYYVSPDGEVSEVPSEFDGRSVTFTTTHFSTYAVVFEDAEEGGIPGYAIILAVIAGIVSVAVLINRGFFRRE